jgi:RNA polymerase sigma-70 factor, ECF subfamily
MSKKMDSPLALALRGPGLADELFRARAHDAATAAPLTLEEVYRQHFDFVYRKAARLGGPGFDAEDAAQEVFLVVGRKLGTYDGSSAVTTWLYGILLNIVRRARRRQRLKGLFERGGPSTDEPVREPDRVEVGEARRIAYAILDRLKTKHRDVFILSEFEGLSREEIARVVGCRVETVWSRLHYARKEFAGRLAKRGLGRAP